MRLQLPNVIEIYQKDVNLARNIKIVTNESGVDRRETGYYSTPDFISKYISKKLHELCPKASIALDPCVGKGEMTLHVKRPHLKVHGIDILDFSPECVDYFTQDDFIDLFIDDHLSPLLGRKLPSPDIIIANPPYNCHETDYLRSNKKRFAAIFGSHATLNMYSLFLSAIIRLAKPGAAIGVIIHDSFLTARGHEALRREILKNCTVHCLHLCPTDLFFKQGADVRTCILIMQKTKKTIGYIATSNRPASTHDFQTLLETENFEFVKQDELCLSGERDRMEFLIEVPNKVRELFLESRLGEKFPCITGISTGNDRLHLSASQSDEFPYPFYKNPSSRRFYTQPDAFLTTNFLTLDSTISNFMVRNKRYLFKGGITCSSMGVAFGAAVLPKNSVFGVNANIIVEGNDKWWLLAYLNSSLCTYIVRGVMIRSNMITAGYVSRIPIPSLSKTAKEKIGSLANKAYEAKTVPKESQFYISQIDRVIYDDLKFNSQIINFISEFSSNVTKLT